MTNAQELPVFGVGPESKANGEYLDVRPRQ